MPIKEKVFSRTGHKIRLLYPIIDDKNMIVDLVPLEEWEAAENRGPDSPGVRMGSVFNEERGVYEIPLTRDEISEMVNNTRDSKIKEYMEAIGITSEDYIRELYMRAQNSDGGAKIGVIMDDNSIKEITRADLKKTCEDYYKYKEKIFIAGRQLKDMSKLPRDWKEDGYWN